MTGRTRRKSVPLSAATSPAADGSLPLRRRDAREGELVDKTGRLMMETELGRHFGVGRITIRNAMVHEGMFARTRGRGAFLRSNQPEKWVAY